VADEEQPIIIKKINKIEGGHHGGAWKVAYADFVTAMMAFFLLLWLLNVTTTEQKAGIADYFSPQSVSDSRSGASGVLGGKIITDDTANRASESASIIAVTESPQGYVPDGSENPEDREGQASEAYVDQVDEAIAQREEEMFEQAREEIQTAIESVPELADLGNNIIIDMTPEGLRIQLVDKESYSMFPSGSARMNKKTYGLLGKIAQVVTKMPNKVAIAGHTDSHGFSTGGNYSNWELSTDRANAARRVLVDSKVPAERVNRVMGKADAEHLFEDPYDPRNRRISIVLLRQSMIDGNKRYIEKTREAIEEREGKRPPIRDNFKKQNQEKQQDSPDAYR